MNKTDKAIIKKYENNIKTAGESNYTRGMPIHALEQLQDIYNREMKTDLHENFTCGTCILRFLKLFYKKIYIKYEKE